MRLYQEDIDEQLIMERTGHRSNAVRLYKRTSNGQMRDVSNILYGKSNSTEAQMSPKKCICTGSVSDSNENPVKVNVNENIVETKKEQEDTGNICVNVSVNFTK